jgi:hypothetical protein
MKTDTLISLLAAGVTPVDRHVVVRRLTWALVAGTLGAALFVVLCYGIRPDIREMLTTPLFWAKMAFPTCLAVGALAVTLRLSRPGTAVGRAWAGLAFPVAVSWLCGLALWWLAPPEERESLLMGHTWRTCPFNIAFLSIPAFIAVRYAMRGLAPTRLRLAGAAAGLLAGATATVMYCLHCPEMGVPFWAVWYVLGMAIPTLVGAIAGPRWLRW